MCGIFGNFNFSLSKISKIKLEKLAETIRHRGPDAVGIETDKRASIGNVRLSIIDLSSASNQPIISKDNHIVLAQNGEIYNYIELRDELRKEGFSFETEGDTEILLKAYQAWGVNFIEKVNGMFAIAIHDRTKDILILYRDRLGVKPLYYWGEPENGEFWFASEIKALLRTGLSASPNLDSIAQYLALNYIPQPETAFEGIKQLPPGHRALISAKGIEIKPFWDLSKIRPDNNMDRSEGISHILKLLDDSTRIRMRSDAPFGAFLSGGLDSSAVVGFMSLYKPEPIRTYSVGFMNPDFDESQYAKQVSHRFGTQHKIQIMDQDIETLWPHFIWHADQPHGDVSFIPTGVLAKMASQDVKMVLTGDGGDELFAGYEKYLNFFSGLNLEKLNHKWEDEFVRSCGLLHYDEPLLLLKGRLREAFLDSDPYRALSGQIRKIDNQDPINKVLFAETTTLLPGNNLIKPDRMAMANSLEVRSPFLDYRLAEFAFKIPGKYKLEGGKTKAILKTAVEPLLGKSITYRKKQMFTVPVGDWFRQKLGSFCREIMLDGRLADREIINEKFIKNMIGNHISGEKNYTRQIRALVSLEIWFRLFIDGDHSLLNKDNI